MRLPSNCHHSFALTTMAFLTIVLSFATMVLAQDSTQNTQRSSFTVADESPVIYDITSAATMAALPDALQQELLALQNAIRAAGQQFLYRHTSASNSNSLADEHYVIFDAFASKANARTFPNNRQQARQLFQKQGLRKGGLLPWVLIDHHALLKAAFASQKSETVAQEIAAIVHFSADAAMAFHVSNNGFASVVANKADREAPVKINERYAANWWRGKSLYTRCQIETLAWSRNRLEHETRVWPGRIKPISKPINVVFKFITQAHVLRDELIALDREICASLVINNEQDFLQRADAYYLAMSERAGHLHRWQLENGALLAARLITDAWQQSGRLSIEKTSAGISHPNDVENEQSISKIDKLVGSKSSKIFHRASCPHVKRINSENLVPFDSAQTATKQGRRPCRTCQPK